MSGLSPSFMKIWTCGGSPRSGSRNAWRRIKNYNGASRLSKIWNFFGEIGMISRRDWWPWTKPGYVTMTRIQSNDQWSGGIAAPSPQNFLSAKIRWKISRLDFLGSRRHPPDWKSSKGQNYQRGVLTTSAGAIEGHFERKTPREGHQGCLVLAWQCPRLTGHLQPRRNWPTWASSFLFTHPILRIWSRRTTTCSLDWKNKRKVTIFPPMRRSILLRRPGWTENILIFFWAA